MRKLPLRKRVAGLAGRFAFRVLTAVSKKLNLDRIQRWGRGLGDFMWFGSKRYRIVVRRGLTRSFPEWSQAEVEKTAREVFRQFGRGALEFFHLLNLTKDQICEWVDVEGSENVDRALEEGNGVVMITAHCGNWELFARRLSLAGYPINVIARDSDDPGMTGIANKIREDAGYRVISRDNAALPSLRRLKKNEVLGILPDQNSFTGIMVDFFGSPAMTATGPAVFKLKSGATILCAFSRRQADGRFKAVVHPPLEVPLSGHEEEDIRAITAAYTKAIEDEIRLNPSQWLWLHDRWRRADDIVSGKFREER